jgi:hypothetical protein
MVKCANCESSANYTNADPGTNPVNYCAKCLPLWLRDRASQGDFPLVTPIVDETPKPVKKKTPKGSK